MSEATEVGSAPSSAPNSAQGSDATGDACCTSDSHGYITAKGDYLARLRRIEGQARGLQHRPLRRQRRCCRWARGGREDQRSERRDCAIGPLIEL